MILLVRRSAVRRSFAVDAFARFALLLPKTGKWPIHGSGLDPSDVSRQHAAQYEASNATVKLHGGIHGSAKAGRAKALHAGTRRITRLRGCLVTGTKL